MKRESNGATGASAGWLTVFLPAILWLCLTAPGRAQETPSVLKIGVYDSRVVVFAWSRSAYFTGEMKALRAVGDSAMKSGDTARMREITIRMISHQHLLHQMVFGTGTAHEILALVKERLPEVARESGTALLVSRFELPYHDPSLQTVDVTDQIAALFHPTADIREMTKEIGAAEPVALEKLIIEPEMLEGFCNRFGKK